MIVLEAIIKFWISSIFCIDNVVWVFRMEKHIIEKIAKQIVDNCLRIRSGDMVTINTWHHMIELAEEIAFRCYYVGAIPLITLMTDNL